MRCEPVGNDLAHGGKLLKQDRLALSSQSIRAATLNQFQGLDPALFLQASKRSIKRSHLQVSATKLLNILNHGIAMLLSTGETG